MAGLVDRARAAASPVQQVVSDGGQVAGFQVGRVVDGGVDVDLGAGQNEAGVRGPDEQRPGGLAWRAPGRPVVAEVVVGAPAGVEPDLGLAGVPGGPARELGGVAVLRLGGDDPALPAQWPAAVCGDVAGDEPPPAGTAASADPRRCASASRANICRIRWPAPVR